MLSLIQKLYEKLAAVEPTPKIFLKLAEGEDVCFINPSRQTLGVCIYAYSRGIDASTFLETALQEGISVVVRANEQWIPWEVFSINQTPVVSWGAPWWVTAIGERGITFGGESLTPERAEALASELLSERERLAQAD